MKYRIKEKLAVKLKEDVTFKPSESLLVPVTVEKLDVVPATVAAIFLPDQELLCKGVIMGGVVEMPNGAFVNVLTTPDMESISIKKDTVIAHIALVELGESKTLLLPPV